MTIIYFFVALFILVYWFMPGDRCNICNKKRKFRHMTYWGGEWCKPDCVTRDFLNGEQ